MKHHWFKSTDIVISASSDGKIHMGDNPKLPVAYSHYIRWYQFSSTLHHQTIYGENRTWAQARPRIIFLQHFVLFCVLYCCYSRHNLHRTQLDRTQHKMILFDFMLLSYKWLWQDIFQFIKAVAFKLK